MDHIPKPAVYFSCKHLYIPSLLISIPVSQGQMSVLAPRVVYLSSLAHCFTSPLLHYLRVRLNNGMGEGARELKCAIEQKNRAASAKALSAEQSLDT